MIMIMIINEMPLKREPSTSGLLINTANSFLKRPEFCSFFILGCKYYIIQKVYMCVFLYPCIN